MVDARLPPRRPRARAARSLADAAQRRPQPPARPRPGGAAYRAQPAAQRAGGAGRIGIVVNLEPKDAATDRDDDLAATARADAYMNRQYLDPLLLGRYPEELRRDLRRRTGPTTRRPTSR